MIRECLGDDKMTKHIVFIESSTTGAGEKAHEYSKQMGYYITFISRNPHIYSSDLLNMANEIIICETNSIELLSKEIKEINKRFKIDGITTTADFYVPNASKVAQDLGLPSLTYNASLGVRNKYKMRLNLEKYCPHLNPKFRLVNNQKDSLKAVENLAYPLIAKPQDANDSWNVKLIKNESELINYLDLSQEWKLNSFGQPLSKEVLLEEYIDGEEFSVETMQFKGGNIQLIGVTSKVLFGKENGHFIEVGGYFPTNTNESELLFNEVSNALKHLDIDCGVIHTECRIKNGQVKILEINPRLVGNKVGSHVIELSTGINPVKAVVEIALGNEFIWKPSNKNGAALFGLCMNKPGVFNGISNIGTIKKLPGVIYVEVTGELGRKYDLPSSNEDIVALIITKAESSVKALELAKNASQKTNLIIN